MVITVDTDEVSTITMNGDKMIINSDDCNWQLVINYNVLIVIPHYKSLLYIIASGHEQ